MNIIPIIGRCLLREVFGIKRFYYSVKILFCVGLMLLLLAKPADAQKPELVVQTGHVDSITAIAFSPDGHLVASSAGDQTIKLWDVRTGKEIRTFKGHDDQVVALAFSPDNTVVASGSWDETVKIWDILTGKELCTLTGHEHMVSSVAFSPDGRVVASGSWDETLKLWDVQTGNVLHTLTGHAGIVSFVTFSPDGQVAISCAVDGIRFWDRYTGKNLGHAAGVKMVAFSSDGHIAAYGLTDGRILLWDSHDKKALPHLTEHSGQILSFAFRPEGNTLVSVNEYETVQHWDIRNGQKLQIVKGQTSWAETVALHPNGKIVASVSDYQNITLWDADTGRELRTLTGYADATPAVLVSPDGSVLAGGSGMGKVQLWDIHSRIRVQTFRDPSFAVVASIAFSPEADILAVGHGNGTIQLRNIPTGQEVCTLLGHSEVSPVSSLAFSPDGHILASGSFDETIKLWDVQTCKALHSFPERSNLVYAVAFSPDDQVILFFAGHGLLDEQLDYYFATTDIDFDHPSGRGLPYEAIEGLLDGIPARKKLLLMDTCHSGEMDKEDVQVVTAADTLEIEDGPVRSHSFHRGLKRLRENSLGLHNSFELLQELFANLQRGSGAMVISAASGLEFAYESGRYQNGLFTYAVLEGLQGEAGTNIDEGILVSELRDYVTTKVRELTKNQQTPTARRENVEFDFWVY